ncbi:SOS response-associated peptidase [Qipengyuania sp.]|uniref:SOS response-associated peptidase n=1 Tax=Qipengyuania sp. TaxID=2004515 RepID=UPI003735A5F9
MCNLYRIKETAAEIAGLFEVANEAIGSNAAELVYPGYPGLVIAAGAVRSMVWGFPLQQASKRTGQPLKPRPVNNARAENLGSFMWRYSFVERRCLIPLGAWAEAEGPRGAMTRTWLGLPDTPVFAVAGLWRDSVEWGPCYTMIMTQAAGDARAVHDRMPVILDPRDFETWTKGLPDDAFALCRGYAGGLAIDRTGEPWAG